MILSISTASEKISIALFKKNILARDVKWESYRTQSKELLPEIDKMLRENKIKLEEIKCIVVSQGPGSFTGLRVGIAVANALAVSLCIPVYGIKNSNEALLNAKKISAKNNLKKFAKTGKIVMPFYDSKL